MITAKRYFSILGRVTGFVQDDRVKTITFGCHSENCLASLTASIDDESVTCGACKKVNEITWKADDKK